MPQQVIPPRLSYRLLDPNNGSVVVPDLYHLNQSEWTVRALVAGYPGSTTLGEFRVILPPPSSDEHWRYRSQYDAILNSYNSGIGLKVEGYDSNVNAGAPVVSGVVTKMDLPLDTPWVLSGVDTLFWLQQSQLYAGEILYSPQGASLVKKFIATQEVLWDDDFTNWSGGANYTQTGGVWATGTDPVFGFTAVAPNASGAVLTTNTTWSSQQFGSAGIGSASAVTAHGVIVGNNNVTDAGTASIVFSSDSTGQNCLRFSTRLINQGGNVWNVNGLIDSVAGGVATNLVTTTVLSNVTTGLAAGVINFGFEMTAIMSANSGFAPPSLVRLIINGNDSNCQASHNVVTTPGSVGFEAVTLAGGVYFNRLTFHARTGQTLPGGTGWGTNRFQAGTFGLNGSYMSTVLGQGQTHLDILLLSAALDGYNIRKNPQAGYKSDIIDYIASVGADRSAQVVFEEGVNLIAQGTTFQNVGEVFSTEARTVAVPPGSGTGSDSGGNVTWGRMGSPGDLVLTDTSADVGIVGYTMLMVYGRLIAQRKQSPLTGIQVAIARTADLLAANNGWGPREWDFVTLHAPTYNVEHQKVQIVGYSFKETDAFVTYYITQFPEKSMVGAPFQSIRRGIEFVHNTYKAR